MRKITFYLTLLVFSVSLPAMAAEPSGNWELNMMGPMGPEVWKLNFKADGSIEGEHPLFGSIKGENKSLGDKFHAIFKVNAPMGEMVFNFVGTHDGSKGKGDVEVLGNPVPWDAVKKMSGAAPPMPLTRQATDEKGLKKALMPLGHNEFFYPFMNVIAGEDPADRTIQKFLISLYKRPILGPYGISLVTTEEPVTAGLLADMDVLYIVTPKKPYSAAEVAVIVHYVKNGGSLFLVMDQELRSSIDPSKPNYSKMDQLIKPFGMGMSHDVHEAYWGGNDIPNHGAIAKKGVINKEDRELPCHGVRHIIGGTPFSYIMDGKGPTELVHGAYKEVEGGGRIIVLGDVMASLLFLGSSAGIRLQGGYGVPNPWWGKDSQIFLVDCFQWLVANNKN